MGGVTHLGISEGKGGIKHGSCPRLGMDIFWNCPFHVLRVSAYKSFHRTVIAIGNH